MENDRLQNLDGLRGFAIALVLLYHSFTRWTNIEPWQHYDLVKNAFANGWLGVNLFFMISGFVIFYSLDRSSTFFSFILKRWLRLFPAMLVCSILIYSTVSLIPNRPLGIPKPGDLLPGLLFLDPGILKRIFLTQFQALDGAFWSLFVETKFYFLSAFSFFVLRDRRAMAITFLYSAYIGLSQLDYFYVDDPKLSLILELFRFSGINYYAWFLLGIYYYFFSRTHEYKYLYYFIFALIVEIIQIYYAKNVTVFFLSLTLPLLFLLSFHNHMVSRFFTSKFFLFLGFISYPLYLFHQNFIVGFGIEIFKVQPNYFPPFYPVVPIVLSCLVALFIARIEPYLRQYIRIVFLSVGLRI